MMADAELAALKTKLALMSDDEYQLTRKDLAHEFQLKLTFLDKLHKQERTARGTALGADAGGRPSQADELVALARAQTVLLFHDDDVNYAVVAAPHKGGEHREVWALRSRQFKIWLARIFHIKTQKAANGEAVANAIATLEGFARFEGPEHRVWIRLAEHDDKIYLDLANERWQAVQIDGAGWRIVEGATCEVYFRRTRAMLPLPSPIPQADHSALTDLARFLHLGESTSVLVIAWLVGALRPTGPYAVLNFHGEQGATKSSTQKRLRSLVDPNKAISRAAPKEIRDLQIAANNSWVVSLDNLSHLAPWLSDGLCRLSTGGGFASRELYKDGDEFVMEAQRPVILNGIEELTTRADLLDRAIICELENIDKKSRKQEKELDCTFEAMRPQVLGALLNAVSCAVRNVVTGEIPELPRMADFAAWVMAAEPALPWKRGNFLELYLENIAAANTLTLEASAIFPLIEKLLPFKGTASMLLDAIAAQLPETAKGTKKKPEEFPSNARALSGALKRIAPNMRRAGIDVSWVKDAGARVIIIRRAAQDAKNGQNEDFASTETPQEQRPFDPQGRKDAKDANFLNSVAGVHDAENGALREDEMDRLAELDVAPVCRRCGLEAETDAENCFHCAQPYGEEP